eukprot:jgi/Mesen1/7293/ME000373S06364
MAETASSSLTPGKMRAMVLEEQGLPLQCRELPMPEPGHGEVRVKVDGELLHPKLPLIPGHEIIGLVDKIGPGVDAGSLQLGTRVGIPWLGKTCGRCEYCAEGMENLCNDASFTVEEQRGVVSRGQAAVVQALQVAREVVDALRVQRDGLRSWTVRLRLELRLRLGLRLRLRLRLSLGLGGSGAGPKAGAEAEAEGADGLVAGRRTGGELASAHLLAVEVVAVLAHDLGGGGGVGVLALHQVDGHVVQALAKQHL